MDERAQRVSQIAREIVDEGDTTGVANPVLHGSRRAHPGLRIPRTALVFEALVPNPDKRLRPGLFAKVRALMGTEKGALLVPQRAVQQGAKGHFVWVVDKDGKAEYRPVTVGEWQGNDWFVTEGLRAGDQVAVDGALTLQPGALVTAKPLAAATNSTPQAAPARPGN